MRTWWMAWVVCGLVLFSRAARAQEPIEALVGAGLGYRWTSAIDLAEQAGASGYGEGDDTTGRGILSLFELRGGVLLPLSLELDAGAWIGIGGLAIDDVEERYFSTTDEVGSTLAAGIEASARYAPRLAPDWRLLLGPGAGWSSLTTASGVGSARIDLIGVGLDLGARLHLNPIGRVADGHLELVLRARRELPVAVRVESAPGDVLLRGTAGSSDPIWSVGGTISYVFSFHRAR